MPPNAKRRPARGGADRGSGNERSVRQYRKAEPVATERRIVIKHDAFDPNRFDVMVIPPITSHPLDREHDNIRSARGYASGLKLALGIPVIDEIEP